MPGAVEAMGGGLWAEDPEDADRARGQVAREPGGRSKGERTFAPWKPYQRPLGNASLWLLKGNTKAEVSRDLALVNGYDGESASLHQRRPLHVRVSNRKFSGLGGHCLAGVRTSVAPRRPLGRAVRGLFQRVLMRCPIAVRLSTKKVQGLESGPLVVF